MMIFYHATFTSMGFYWGTCFTRQNYSLILNHVKHFPLFCHCYFIIFNYDLYYLLKPVKICFFWKKCHCIWSDIGPDMCLDLIPILAIQWWLQACSVLLFEFQKVALKRILGTFFSNDPVYNRQEVGEASALLPYHNFSKNSSFVWILITCT